MYNQMDLLSVVDEQPSGWKNLGKIHPNSESMFPLTAESLGFSFESDIFKTESMEHIDKQGTIK